MTPAQLLRRLDRQPPPVPATAVAVNDFAVSANMSVYSCLKQKTCPICGNKGSVEHYEAGVGGNAPSTYFYCDASKQHIFEFDDDGFADRVPM